MTGNDCADTACRNFRASPPVPPPMASHVLRILHVSAGLSPGSGIAEVVTRLARQQVALGHAVTIASLKGVEAAGLQQARDGGVEVVLFQRLCGYVAPGMLFGLARLLGRADVVHVHGNWTFPAWVGCGWALASGRPYVVTAHGSLDPIRLRHSAWKKRLAGLIDRYFLRHASVIHATSETEAAWVRDYLRLDAEHSVPDIRQATLPGQECSTRSCSAGVGVLDVAFSPSPHGCYGSRGRSPSIDRHQAVDDGSLGGRASSRAVCARLGAWLCKRSTVNSYTFRTRRSVGCDHRDKPRIVVIPNGVDLPPCGKPMTTQRRRGEISRTAEGTSTQTVAGGSEHDGTHCLRTMLYLGRLHPLKGLDLLLEAWARVQQTSGCLTGEGEGETGGFNAETQRRRGEEGEGRRETGDGGREAGENAQRSSDQHPYTPIATRTHAPTVTFPDTPQCFRQSSRQSSRQSLENATPELPNSQTLELPPHPPTSLDWRLVIAGPDEQGTLAALERQARRLGLRLEARDPLAPDVPLAGAETEALGLDLDPTITYAGSRYGEEKLRLLHEADLVVLPSRSENFGLVVAEALAAGVPVVTTKAAPWAELLGEPGEFNAETQRRGERDNAEAQRRGEEGNAEAQRRGGGEGQLPDACFSRCGWWVEVGAEPLAEALGEAMSLTDEDRRLLGANGHRLVEAKYRWEAVAEQVVEAYRQVRGEA